MRLTLALLSLALISACNRSPEQPPIENGPANFGESEIAQAIPPPATGPNARTPLAEPRVPIDPKSAEAAGQVVQHYGALIEQKRWTESWKLWSESDAARQFDRNWRDFSEIHLEIGDLGDTEGAAGSIYTTLPVVFYGKKTNGADYRERAEVILRRVNDVPGSTEAQRRWHIERIELKAAR